MNVAKLLPQKDDGDAERMLMPTCEVLLLFMQAILWVTKGVLPKDAGYEIGSLRGCANLVLDIVQAAITVPQLTSWLQCCTEIVCYARHVLV